MKNNKKIKQRKNIIISICYFIIIFFILDEISKKITILLHIKG